MYYKYNTGKNMTKIIKFPIQFTNMAAAFWMVYIVCYVIEINDGRCTNFIPCEKKSDLQCTVNGYLNKQKNNNK